MTGVVLFWLVSVLVFLAVGTAVGRWWIVGAPLLLGAAFGVLVIVNGPGDTATWFVIALLAVAVAVACGAAGAGVALAQHVRRDSAERT